MFFLSWLVRKVIFFFQWTFKQHQLYANTTVNCMLTDLMQIRVNEL